GSIILFHDEPGNEQATLNALKALVPALKYRGFRFATLNQLFGFAKLGPCVPNPLGQFESAGVKKGTTGPIYSFWLSHLCRGIQFGPATSAPMTDKQGVISQDFATRGRQIVFHP